ncbi:hypothetical protein Cantr_02163 [Candida viswanathii]|uniref:Uncharacterized protein n=1 Tax=Candida viswanathii TaxID=5486 RepID=A0A367YLH4_9ASCO|nr:hypothetical protein Cantr_02163 [Candida viswanathii]
MLKTFTFDEDQLRVHNERFECDPVEDDKDIEDALKTPPLLANDAARTPLYLGNYAMVKHIPEMMSTKQRWSPKSR